MNTSPAFPNLGALSGAEKDQLITELWHAVHGPKSWVADEIVGSHGTPQDNGHADDRPLLQRIKRSIPEQRTAVDLSTISATLGKGLGAWPFRLFFIAMVLAACILCADYGIGWYLEYDLTRKRQAVLRLENAAFSNLSVELANLVYEPDPDSYRVTMALENLDPGTPIYVMLSPVRVFEQSGLVWKEVPAQAPSKMQAGVVKLTKRFVYETVFEPNLKEWDLANPRIHAHTLRQQSSNQPAY